MKRREMKQAIFLCDDDQGLVGNLKEFFGREYRVVTAYTLKKGIERLDQNRGLPPENRFSVAVFDLAFVEDRSRGVDEEAGFELLSYAMKDRYLESIIYTGTGNEAKAYRAMARGAFRYVPKKADTSKGDCDLADAVRHGIRSHDAILALAQSIDKLSNASSGDSEVLGHAKRVFDLVLEIRGRGGSHNDG